MHLKTGESQKIRIELNERDLNMVNEAGDTIIAGGSYSVSIGGGHLNTVNQTSLGRFT